MEMEFVNHLYPAEELSVQQWNAAADNILPQSGEKQDRVRAELRGFQQQ